MGGFPSQIGAILAFSKEQVHRMLIFAIFPISRCSKERHRGGAGGETCAAPATIIVLSKGNSSAAVYTTLIVTHLDFFVNTVIL
jgi:hypothetical protein